MWRSKSLAVVCLALSVQLALVVGPATGTEPKYTLLRLGLLGTANRDGLNDLGQVAGTYLASEGQYQAALTRPNQPFDPATDIITPLVINHRGDGLGVNDLGQTVGSFSPAVGINPKAFRTQPNAPVNFATDNLMPGLNPRLTGRAVAINNLGQAVGSNGLFAFRTSANGEPLQIFDLGGLFGGGADARNINELGQVTGISAGQAFRTGPNEPIKDADALGILGTSGISFGLDINNGGVVVGGSELTLFGDHHAFRAIPGQPMEDLGTLNGAHNSEASAINEAGWIVGASNGGVVPSSPSAVLWHDGQIFDLNTLIDRSEFMYLDAALDINNKGQILVNYFEYLGGGDFDAGLGILTPIAVPEPNSLLLAIPGVFVGSFLIARKLYTKINA